MSETPPRGLGRPPGPLCHDGSPDMRHKINREAAAAAGMGTFEYKSLHTPPSAGGSAAAGESVGGSASNARSSARPPQPPMPSPRPLYADGSKDMRFSGPLFQDVGDGNELALEQASRSASATSSSSSLFNSVSACGLRPPVPGGLSSASSTSSTLSRASSTGSVASLSFDELEPMPGPDARARVGGFGVVFPAMWPRKRVKVAVKFFKLSALASGGDAALAEAARLLEQEASALLLAQHGGTNEHVLKVYGIARGPARNWLATLGATYGGQCGGSAAAEPSHAVGAGKPVTEYIALVTAWEAGGSLHTHMYPSAVAAEEPPAVSWPRITRDKVRLLRDIAIGLWHLHCNDAACIIHGDIKPANVLLSANPHMPGATPSAKLADFGFVELRAAAEASASGISSVRVATDERGTWPYMCPSLSKTKAAPAAAPSRSSDMYAFGTLAWEVLTGSAPWDGHDAVSRLVALRTGDDALDMASLPGDTPAAVVQLVDQCLRLDRAGRATVDDARAVLERAAVELDSGHFNCFLSHAWGAAPAHEGHKAATALASVLCKNHLRVWVDEREMGHDLAASMRAGVANSDVCVVLLTRPYTSSAACMFELRTAVELGKPIITILLETGRWQDWVPAPDAANGDLAQLAGLSAGTMKMYVDLRDSGAVGGAALAEGSAAAASASDSAAVVGAASAAGPAVGGAGAEPVAVAAAAASTTSAAAAAGGSPAASTRESSAPSDPGSRLRAFLAQPAGKVKLEQLLQLIHGVCNPASASASPASSPVLSRTGSAVSSAVRSAASHGSGGGDAAAGAEVVSTGSVSAGSGAAAVETLRDDGVSAGSGSAALLP